MKPIILMMILALSLIGCGKKIESSSKEVSISKASSLLDAGEYESAIQVLEPLHNANPDDPEVGKKLLHAYAGAGSFEALKVASIWKEIEVILDDIKEKQKEKLKKASLESVSSLLSEVERILQPIPELSELQVKRLNQAIRLYQDLGMTVENAGKYNNFKWGVLHTYRLAITIKSIVSSVRRSQAEEPENFKAIEKLVLPKLKMIGQDLFMAYKLYSNSFDKIKKITESIDKILAKTIKDENFKLKINTLAKNEGEFFKSLINDNIKAASSLLNMLGDIYQNNGHKERVKALVKKLPEQELKDSLKRTEQLLKIFIAQFNEDHPEVENKLRSIFTDELKTEVLEAIKQSLKVKNTDPLKELLSSKKPEVEVLKSYYLILKGDFDESDLEENIKIEVENLKKKVDLEMLKAELEEIINDLKKDTKVVELGAEALIAKNEEQLRLRKEALEVEIGKIKEDLSDLTDELKENLGAEDHDAEAEAEIIQDVKNLVEN